MSFEKFTEDLNNSKYASNVYAGLLYEFCRDVINERVDGFNVERISYSDIPTYDSYGNENTDLLLVIYLPDYDIHVKFEGTRSSYNGTEWQSFKKVKPTTKRFTVYE